MEADLNPATHQEGGKPIARSLCPYLGKIDDRETALAFPSPWSRCFRSSKAREIELDHQSSYCLGAGHRNCPILLNPARGIQRKTSRSLVDRKWVILIASLIVLILLGSVFVFWKFAEAGSLFLAPAPLPSATATTGASPTAPATQPVRGGAMEKSTRTLQPAITQTVFSTKTATTIATRPLPAAPVLTTPFVPTQCIVPYGWVAYVVRPGDSLYGLSLIFHVSMQQLQMANCMGASTELYAGRVLYAPFLPPAPTVTPIPPTKTAAPTDVPPTKTQRPAPTEAIPSEAPTAMPTEETAVPTVELPTSAPTTEPPVATP